MLRDYLPLLLHIGVAIGFAVSALLVSVLLGKSGRRTRIKDTAGTETVNDGTFSDVVVGSGNGSIFLSTQAGNLTLNDGSTGSGAGLQRAAGLMRPACWDGRRGCGAQRWPAGSAMDRRQG